MSVHFLGLLAALAFTIGPVALFSDNPIIFLSAKAIAMVFGGTIAAILISFPLSTLRASASAIAEALKSSKLPDYEATTQFFVRMSLLFQENPQRFAHEIKSAGDPYLMKGLELVADGLPLQKISLILKDEMRSRHEAAETAASFVQSISKYPPALGLLATVLAMIAVLEKIGGGNAGIAGIGPAMASGLVATFYGIALANLALLPLAENLSGRGATKLKRLQIIYAGILCVANQESETVIRQSLSALYGMNATDSGRNSRNVRAA